MANKKLRDIFEFIWSLFKYTFLVAAASLIVILIILAGAYKNLRLAAEKGLAGKNQVAAAVQAANNRSFEEALSLASQSQTSFEGALSDLQASHLNPIIKNFKLVSVQINSLEYLVKTAEILSRSVSRIVPILKEMDEITAASPSRSFVDLKTADKEKFLKLIYESEPELNGLRANLELATMNLDKISRISILFPVYKQISETREELDEAVALMGKASPLIKLLPAIAGYPENSRFLVVMQNNDELRPSGGFIGVYGLIDVHDGEIVSMDTEDSYHLDMPASLSDKWNLPPPEPLKKYLKVEKWYLRDANWSPDWPSSARQIASIYNDENIAIGQEAKKFTGIISINPDLIAAMLRITGPIEVQGATYDADNFQPLLQYNVEVAYKDKDISSWDRKDIIDELLAKLQESLFHLPSSKWPQMIKALSASIDKRDIQAFFFNDSWQQLAQELQIDGSIKKTASDYILVADANLGAFKTDAVVKKNLSYRLYPENDKMKASLDLSYLHEGGFDWRTTRYRSFTRVYLPLGSQLKNQEELSRNVDDLSVSTDNEREKTVVSFFFSVEPGQEKHLHFEYYLPENIKEQLKNHDYELLIQKQSGRRQGQTEVQIEDMAGKKKDWSGTSDQDLLFPWN